MAKNEKITIDLIVNGKDVKKATASVDKLNDSATKTSKTAARGAGELDRMDKSLFSAKNQTSSFAKQAQGLGGLVHVYATIAANVFALSAAFSVLKNNADLTIMADSAAELSKTTGTNFGQVAQDIKLITGGAISITDAMRQANLALSGGASIEQVKQIAEIANKAANTLGLSVPEAVTRMTQAVTKGEPELVDEFGIILRVTEATNEYAASIGKAASQLTTFEKQQAIINQLITQGTDKFGDVDIKTNPYAKLGASFEDVTKTILGGLSTVVAPAIELIASNSTLLFSGLILGIISLGKKIIPSISSIGNTFSERATKAAQDAKAAAQDAQDSISGIMKNKENKLDFSEFTVQDIGDVTKSTLKDMGNTIDADSKLAKILANKLGGPELVKELSAQGIPKKIDAALLRLKKNKGGKASVFGIDVAQNKADLEFLQALLSTTTSDFENKVKESYFKIQRLAQLNKQRIAEINSTTLSGISSIVQANGFSDLIKRTKQSFNDLTVASNKSTEGLSLFQRTSLKTRGILGKGALGITAAAKGVGSLASKASIYAASITMGFMAVKAGLGAVGLYNNKLSEQASRIEDVLKNNKKLRDSYLNLNTAMDNIRMSSARVVGETSRVSGVVGQLADNSLKLLSNLEGSTSVGAGQKFLDFVFLEDDIEKKAKQAIATIKRNIGQIDKATKTVESKDIVLFKMSKADVTALQGYNTQLEYLRDTSSDLFKSKMASGGEKRLRKEIQKQRDGIQAITERSKVSFTIGVDFDNTELLDIMANSGELLGLNKEAIKGFFDEIIKPAKNAERSAKAFSDANASMSKIVTDLTNKTDPRRIINADTGIAILANFKDTAAAMLVLGKETKNYYKLGGLIKGTSKEINDAFNLPTLSESFGKEGESTVASDAKEIANYINAVGRVIPNLEKDVEIVRNLKSEISSLDLSKKSNAIDSARGDFQESFVKYQMDELDIINKKIAAKESELRLTEAASRIVGSKDVNKNKLVVAQLKMQIVLLERKAEIDFEAKGLAKGRLAQLKVESGLLKSAIKTTQSKGNINTAKLDLLKQENYAYAISSTIVGNIAKNTKSTAKLKLAELSNQIATKQASIELGNSVLERSNNAALLVDITGLELEQQLLISQEMKKQNDLTRQQFDLDNQSRGVQGSGVNIMGGVMSTVGGRTFGQAVSIELGLAAVEMGSKISNTVKNVVNVATAAFDSFSGAIVDQLINNTWDGKDEGVSFGVAVRETLKATLRSSLGTIIQDQMTASITGLVAAFTGNVTLEKATAIARRTGTAAIYANTSALVAATAAFSLGGGGGKKPAEILTNLVKAIALPESKRPVAIPLPEGQFANGGVVNRPTNALIGEGSNAEAIVPLPNNRSIPVKFEGSTGNSVVVNQSFDFSGANKESEAKLLQYAAQIKQETIREITNNINRGGSLSKVVGRR